MTLAERRADGAPLGDQRGDLGRVEPGDDRRKGGVAAGREWGEGQSFSSQGIGFEPGMQRRV